METIAFHPKILVTISNSSDGSMSKAIDEHERRANREHFLAKAGIPLERSTLVHLKYEGNNYRRYHIVNGLQAGDGMVRPSGMVSDALFTTEKNLALFLPVADCIGAVLYDTKNEVIGLAHFGRHNLAQNGGAEVIEYMSQQFGSFPSDIHAWLSPGAGKETYPLFDFEGQSLQEVALNQLEEEGLDTANISMDRRDTTKDKSFFSHSEYLKGNRTTDGRQAVVAMMRE